MTSLEFFLEFLWINRALHGSIFGDVLSVLLVYPDRSHPRYIVELKRIR